jgi:hypothetical protein
MCFQASRSYLITSAAFTASFSLLPLANEPPSSPLPVQSASAALLKPDAATASRPRTLLRFICDTPDEI